VVSKEPDVISQVRRRLHQRGVRFTVGRDRLVATLWKAPGPRSAGELHRLLKSQVPLSSLYRSLAVLEAAGVVRRHHDPSGLIRFELSEWLSGHHHHLLCADCGVVEDVELDDVSERTLSNLARRFGRRAGYEVAGHGLEIVGVCRDCIPA